MSEFQRGKIDSGTVKDIAKFLFGKDKDETDNQFLDRRTDIQGSGMFSALTYYRILEEEFKSDVAGSIATVLERLSISLKRGGRLEGVSILQQQFPKVENLEQGISELLKKKLGKD